MSLSLSIVLPAYNEEANIAKSIQACLNCLRNRRGEIIVVDDGSTDKTSDIVYKLQKDEPRLQLIVHSINKGYGAALKSGFGQSKMDCIFFTDADLQFDVQEIEKLFHFINDFDIVVGYREKRADPFVRKVNALGWRIVNRILFNIRLKDINCAFKLFNRHVLDGLSIRSNGAFINAEILARAMSQQYRIKEIAVTHYPRHIGQQTGANPKVIVNAFYELGQLYFHIR